MPERPPCLLCGEVLYDPTSVVRCVPCGGRHEDLCATCVVLHRLSNVDELSVRNRVPRLLVCPDAVRMARALMR